MYFRQIYIFIITVSIFITGCQKLVNDPGGEDTNIEVDNGLSYWGGAYDDFGHGVVQTADGGYAVVGTQYSTDTQQDLMLVKFSSTLVFESDTSFGGANSAYNNVANDLQQTADGGYILVGSTFNGTDDDVWVVKYTPTLSLSWQDTIKGPFNDVGNSIQQTLDGSYVVCGTSHDGNDEDIMLWKIAVTGAIPTHSILYSETTNSGTDNGARDFGNYAQQTYDGGYIIVGTSQTATNANDIRLIKLDAENATDGTVTLSVGFDSTYAIADGAYNDEGIFVQQTSDNGYAIVGNYWASGYGQNNVFVLKTDYQGTEVSTATFGGGFNDFGNCVRQTEDGGFIIVGSKLSQATTNEDVWILKLTHDLSTEWDYTYGGSADDIGTSVNQTTDGGYIITGNTYSYGNQSEIILLKIDGSGVVQDFSN